MEGIILKYYSNLFQSSQPTEFAELIEAVVPKVSQEMNSSLTSEFQGVEVFKALKQMYPLKSPGPDGMPPLFFQHFWPTIGNVVTKTILDLLNHSIVPPKFNETHIVLVPKIKNPKKVLPKIIGDTQSAFVHRRLITDNVLVVFETMHHINQKKGGKVGEMALKLDMSKAYDRVEWICLDNIME